MSIEKNDEACVIKREALEYILGLIKNISKVSDGINETDGMKLMKFVLLIVKDLGPGTPDEV